MRKKPIRVYIKKLGREKAAGLAYKQERKIYIDPDQRGLYLFDTLIHEVMHIQHPDLSEEAVSDNAKEMAELLWKFGYRWTDNHRK